MGRFNLLISLTLALAFTPLCSWAFFDGPPPQLPEVTYVPDMLVVNFQLPIRDINPNIVNGIALFGEPSLDLLASKYGVNYIEKEFPGSTPPIDPSEVDLSGYYKVQFNPAFTLEEVLTAFENNPLVEHVEKIGICPVCYTPNDPFFGQQWYLNQTADHDIDAPEAWDLERNDSTPIIAIADTGVDWHHPDLDANIWSNPGEVLDGIDNDGNGYIDDVRGWDWVTGVSGVAGEDVNTPDNDPSDFNGHGTHCSGIASAETDNSTGVAGVAFNARIMALRIGWSGIYGGYEVGFVRMDFAAQAFYYAANEGATVFNASWGSDTSGGIIAAVDYAIAHGLVVCTAAGNDGTQSHSYLGGRDDVVAVAGTTTTDQKWSGSNYGTWVDVCAGAVNVYSTYQFHGGAHTYDYLTGTSMSSPQACGVIALLKAYKPGYTRTQLIDALEQGCDNIDAENPSYIGLLGHGRINARHSLGYTDDVEVVYFNSYDSPQGALLKWEVSLTGGEQVLGYNLYRREKTITPQEKSLGDVEKRSTEQKVNGALITGENPYVYLDTTVEPDNWYIYRLEAVLADESRSLSSTEFCWGATPVEFSLSQNYPNPVDSQTTIAYSLPEGVSWAKMAIYDLTGRLVKEFELSNQPGISKLVWDTTDSQNAPVASGIYIYSLLTDLGSKNQKLVLAR
jgi:subtilisin family serine protease